MPEIPDKLFYKIGEVCEHTDTQPYVLRFWESEFPQLSPRKNRSGQRIYTRHDIELVLTIKKLLYDEEYTIAGARKRLEQEGGEPVEKEPASGPAVRETPRGGGKAETARVSRAKGAPTEVEQLRGRLEEIEGRWRRAEEALGKAEHERSVYQERCERAATVLEALLEKLDALEDAAEGGSG